MLKRWGESIASEFEAGQEQWRRGKETFGTPGAYTSFLDMIEGPVRSLASPVLGTLYAYGEGVDPGYFGGELPHIVTPVGSNARLLAMIRGSEPAASAPERAIIRGSKIPEPAPQPQPLEPPAVAAPKPLEPPAPPSFAEAREGKPRQGIVSVAPSSFSEGFNPQYKDPGNPFFTIRNAHGDVLGRVYGGVSGEKFHIKTVELTNDSTPSPALKRQLSAAIKRKYPDVKRVMHAKKPAPEIWPGAPKAKAKAPLAEGKAVGAAVATTEDILRGNIADREKAFMLAKPGRIEGLKLAAKKLQAVTGFGPDAAYAKGLIREATGQETRDVERASAALEEYRKFVNGLDPGERFDVIDYIQRRTEKATAGYEPSPEIKPLLDTIRGVMLKYRGKYEAASATNKMQFEEDHLKQMWQDPEKAREFFAGGGKEGSSSFTKGKKYATYADGIRAGLIPVTTDPIEIVIRDITAAGRFLSANEVIETASDAGKVIYKKRGAQPTGWAELKGWTAKGTSRHEVAYAPQGFATVWNNYISQGTNGPVSGPLLRGVQGAFNSMTALKLAISAYHAVNMVKESTVGGLSNAIDELAGTVGGTAREIAHGHPMAAGRELTKGSARTARAVVATPFKFVTSAIRGYRVQRAYLHDIGSPHLMKVVDLAAKANFRMRGKGAAIDEYRFSGAVNLFTAFRRGALKLEAQAAAADVKAHPVLGTARAVGKTLASPLETLNSPLFNVYIPLIKNGAMYDMITTWLNKNPTATEAEQVAFARKAADIIDDRFGEMNHDNILWNKTAKQIAQAAVFSYSYELGTGRMAGKAIRDTAKFPFTRDWTPNMSYPVALAIIAGTVGAMTTYFRTGEAPADWRDLYFPRTGGIDARTGKPEREVWPGYDPQFIAFMFDPKQELANKGNMGLQLAYHIANGADWAGHPIAPSDMGALPALRKYLEYSLGEMAPIFMQSMEKQLPGSKIGGVERFMGMRPAPMYAHDPEAYRQMKEHQRLEADANKAWYDYTQSTLQVKGYRPAGKHAFVQSYIARHKKKPYKGVQ
jgi:hypothetical protein